MFWYEADIRQLESKLSSLPPASDRVVFYGSSSIRLWTTLAQDFPQINTLNLGFGGSTLAACAWFFERVIIPANPKSIVFYAGDNDLGDGRNPEEVYLFFCAFAEKLSSVLPGIPLSFLSIKISPVRLGIADQIRFANKLIGSEIKKYSDYQYIDMTAPLLGADGRPRKDFFENDGLHLSPAGYRIWQQVLQQQARIF
ncbi:GDSL family lipase [Spirosoma sp. HMF4905]|uniref:GDSL family lipase n=1 Tax=Spirosoma arboris TaxID=2682092 RepID=A0A7K1SNZ5_9BACT|nr:GDSL-type esterase/lipase family protein [Spirosoma arboris]MVM35534.1 GDSL family lipase [Spirosoma arboris]